MSEMDGLLFDPEEFQSDPKRRKTYQTETEKTLLRLNNLEDRTLRNFETKANRGEILTVAEYRLLEQLRKKITERQACGLQDGDNIVRTGLEVARHFKRTERTIRNWAGRGMPQLPNGYDLKEIERWGIAAGLLQGTEETHGEHDRAYYEMVIKRQQSELNELKLSQQKGEFVAKSDVESLFVSRATELRKALLERGRRLSLRLANKGAAACQKILEEDSRAILEGYSRESNLASAERKI
jgi:phage terminase Nu1 subunit (DNA packaging protein)